MEDLKKKIDEWTGDFNELRDEISGISFGVCSWGSCQYRKNKL